MIRALYSAASGMTAQQLNIDNIANNLANANTAGYKSRRAQFQDLLYQNMVQPGSSAGQSTVVPTGLQLGLGTRAASNEIIFQQGDFSSTNNPLDLVIQGNGFFQIKQASGQNAYTRAGSFHLDSDGQSGHLGRRSASAADHHSSDRAVDQHRNRRNRYLHAAGPDSIAKRRTDYARQFSEPGGTQFPRPQPLSADRRIGRPDSRTSGWNRGTGLAAAGLRRAIECQRGG